MDKLAKSRQLLSTEILHNFIGRITGSGLNRIVGSNPENVLLVGKLMSTNDEGGNNSNTSKTFIESIGTDFYISETEIETALIKLTPQGDFYYRAVPTLKEQQLAMLKEINETIDGISFTTFEDVINACRRDESVFSNVLTKLIPVYKKTSLNAESAQISFQPKTLLDSSGECGFVDEKHVLNMQVTRYLQDLQSQINEDVEAMTQAITEPIKMEQK